jgi:hypothetical protein
MIAAPITVSEHAVDRYLEHWVGHLLSRHQARTVLEISIRTAQHVDDIANEQQSIWKIPDRGHPARTGAIDDTTLLDVLLVVDAAGEVRTVLPPGATRPRARRP